MIRVLLLSDTHIGFDLPVRRRLPHRRRGDDLVDAFCHALAPARRGEVDVVVHAGDLLDRPRVPDAILWRALDPLFEVATHHAPVVLVPGNHERGRIALPPLLAPLDLHVLDRPRAIALDIRGLRLVVGGFPFLRRARSDFDAAVRETGLLRKDADVRLLVVHQAFEGAVVGAHDYVFRRGHEVVRGASVPQGVAAVFAGHVHRHQVLRRDLQGRPLAAPVVVPGSTERTSFQERYETKGAVQLRLAPGSDGGTVADLGFAPLPTRPMVVLEIGPGELHASSLERRFHALPADAVVQLRVAGGPAVAAAPVLRAASLRALAGRHRDVSVPWRRWP